MRGGYLLPVFLIPYAIEAPQIYSWLHHDAHLDNAFYLNAAGFILRGVVYLICWLGLAGLILRAARRLDVDEALERIAPAGLILLALTATFASIDAMLSLEPRFASSVFGLIEIVAMGLLALSVAIFAAMIFGTIDAKALSELSRLTLALTILWAYLDFMQLLIVWQSDLPSEAAWYGPRLSRGWSVLFGAVVLLHFALPFFLLLSARAQAARRVVASAVAALVVSALARDYWLAAPAFEGNFSALAALAACAIILLLCATLVFAMTPLPGERPTAGVLRHVP